MSDGIVASVLSLIKYLLALFQILTLDVDRNQSVMLDEAIESVPKMPGVIWTCRWRHAVMIEFEFVMRASVHLFTKEQKLPKLRNVR